MVDLSAYFATQDGKTVECLLEESESKVLMAHIQFRKAFLTASMFLDKHAISEAKKQLVGVCANQRGVPSVAPGLYVHYIVHSVCLKCILRLTLLTSYSDGLLAVPRNVPERLTRSSKCGKFP
jgi:hypothetical protein